MKFALVAALAAPLLPGNVFAADPPTVKAGLWEIHGQSIENPGGLKTEFTYKLCRSHRFDKAMTATLRNLEGCSTSLNDLGGGRFSAASRCTVNDVVIESKGITVYQSSTSTHSETEAFYTPAWKGKTDETLVEDQKHIGRCPAGMKPGDRMTAGGLIVHSAQ